MDSGGLEQPSAEQDSQIEALHPVAPVFPRFFTVTVLESETNVVKRVGLNVKFTNAPGATVKAWVVTQFEF